MDIYECLRTRRTVREFKPDPVSDESLGKLLSAARWSPSSRNQQPWRFIVIRDRDETLVKLGETAGSGGFLARAPIAIAIVMENADQPQMDAGRVLQQMFCKLVAWSEGMPGCSFRPHWPSTWVWVNLSTTTLTWGMRRGGRTRETS